LAVFLAIAGVLAVLLGFLPLCIFMGSVFTEVVIVRVLGFPVLVLGNA